MRALKMSKIQVCITGFMAYYLFDLREVSSPLELAKKKKNDESRLIKCTKMKSLAPHR